MKVADGFWCGKPGYDVNYAEQIYEVTADKNPSARWQPRSGYRTAE